MSKRMLGIDSAVLRKLWCGPLADLVVKLTGSNGEEVERELNRFLREEPCQIGKSRALEVQVNKPLVFALAKYTHLFLGIIGKPNWGIIRDGAFEDCTATNEIDLNKIKFVPAADGRPSMIERRVLRERGHTLLAEVAFSVCWENRDRLPEWWRHYGQIYFDGFVLQAPCPNGRDEFDCQWGVKMYYHYDRGWQYYLEKIDGIFRYTADHCSAIYVN
jgi:hypothetical protein